jgi:hypothetical protein
MAGRGHSAAGRPGSLLLLALALAALAPLRAAAQTCGLGPPCAFKARSACRAAVTEAKVRRAGAGGRVAWRHHDTPW